MKFVFTRPTSFLYIFFITLIGFFPFIQGSIQPISSTKYTIQQFGSAEASISYLFEANITTETIISATCAHQDTQREIVTDTSITTTQTAKAGVYNVTLNLAFDAWVGIAKFKISIQTKDAENNERNYQYDDEHHVYGVSIYNSDNIVSGDNAKGLIFKDYQNAIDGSQLSVLFHTPEMEANKDISIIVDGDKNAKEMLPTGSIVFSDNQLKIQPAKYRVAMNVPVRIEFTGYQIDEESIETSLIISVLGTAPPAIDTIGTVNVSVSSTNSKFILNMFNLANITGIKTMIGDAEFIGMLPTEQNEESVTFISEKIPKPGNYDVIIDTTKQNDQFEEAMNVGNLKAFVPVSKRNELNGRRPWILGISVAVGCVCLIGIIATIAIMTVRSNRIAASNDASFSDGSSMANGAADLHIARDIYGRGSVAV